MRDGYKVTIIIVIICFLGGCSPADRFIRLVTKHPHLLETISHDTVRIRTTLPKDTLLVWSKQSDTIVFNQVRIERRNDSVKIIVKERPCTTFIQKTEYRPSKIIEKYAQSKKPKFWDKLERYGLYLLLLLSLFILLFRR